MTPAEIKLAVKPCDLVCLKAEFRKGETTLAVSIGEVTEITDQQITLTSEKRIDARGVETYSSRHVFFFVYWDIKEIVLLTGASK